MNEKKKLREHFKEIRQRIKPARRLWSALDLCGWFDAFFPKEGLVLSFHSFKSEIDTGRLNTFLAEKKRLVLPKAVDQNLLLFLVENPEKELTIGSFGILEPDEKTCQPIDRNELKFALIPALAFDKRRHRLGFGKGYFDRFLENRPFTAYGVGFLEQYTRFDLPDEPHDQKLDDIKLF